MSATDWESAAFFSYSSRDIEFARKLAQDLRRHGAVVWMDKLDIKPGDRWDKAVERAMEKCSRMLVILSPDAVDSTNVMDEVSFALEETKVIIPVLHLECKLPFRLRRLHYVDVRTDYDRGLQELIGVLGASQMDAQPEPTRETSIAVETRVSPKDGMTYVWIPPGNFTMGVSPGDTEARDNEEPAHAEHIVTGFWLGQTPVTWAAWNKVMGVGNSQYVWREAHKRLERPQGDRLPVESVTWTEAADYCTAVGGRLPTEKEWEYAARAGTTGPRYGVIDDIAWYQGNSELTTHPVALKQPNAFGLYDMLGNVFEWMADDYKDDYKDESKAIRGGGWNSGTQNIRASFRGWFHPAARDAVQGFRCVAEFR